MRSDLFEPRAHRRPLPPEQQVQHERQQQQRHMQVLRREWHERGLHAPPPRPASIDQGGGGGEHNHKQSEQQALLDRSSHQNQPHALTNLNTNTNTNSYRCIKSVANAAGASDDARAHHEQQQQESHRRHHRQVGEQTLARMRRAASSTSTSTAAAAAAAANAALTCARISAAAVGAHLQAGEERRARHAHLEPQVREESSRTVRPFSPKTVRNNRGFDTYTTTTYNINNCSSYEY